jgi:hypothetical protein
VNGEKTKIEGKLTYLGKKNNRNKIRNVFLCFFSNTQERCMSFEKREKKLDQRERHPSDFVLEKSASAWNPDQRERRPSDFVLEKSTSALNPGQLQGFH